MYNEQRQYYSDISNEQNSDFNDNYSYNGYNYSYDYYEYYSDESLYSFLDFLDIYISGFLIVMCFVGNLLSAIILGLLTSKTTTFSYLVMVSILDFLSLYNTALIHWLRIVSGRDYIKLLTLESELYCKVYNFLSSSVYHAHGLCFLVPIVEMCLVSRDPANAHHICSYDRAKHIGLVLLLLVICINGHYFFTYGLVAPYASMEAQWECTFLPGGGRHEFFRVYFWPITDNLIASILPLLITILSLVFICRRKVPTVLLSNRHLIYPEVMLQCRSCVIVLAILFLILTLPEAFYNLFEYILEQCGLTYDKSVELPRIILPSLTGCLKDMFSSLKIVVYLVTMPIFRKQTITIFKCIKCSSKTEYVKPRLDDESINNADRTASAGSEELT